MIGAPSSEIYAAFLNPDSLVKWLPPTGMAGHLYDFEPREGGVFRMALTYKEHSPSTRGKTTEDSDIVAGRFLKLLPCKQIAQSVRFESEDPLYAGEMRMTWDLSAEGCGTKVTITCENVPEGIRQEDHDAGLRSTLENLAKFVER